MGTAMAQMSSPKHLSDSDPDPAASARPQSANPADAQEGAQAFAAKREPAWKTGR